jgi:adenylate cyclase
MANEGFKRKLTAVLSADAVEYSRLMADDEAATVKTIASYREIMSSLIKQHRGRVVDSPGDNMLAEFSSVVDAVQCALAMQNEFQARNAELEKNRQMHFRIGINLGDVIDEDDRIYGDGVNIAARLESLADPGGICVSKTAFDQIETKLPLGYEYLGEQSVKNIPKPVGAYRVLMKPDAAGKVIGEKRFLGRFSRKAALAAIVILAVIAGSLVAWNIYLQQSKKVESASVEKMALPLPDKPSVVVLPFDNLGDDPEQSFLADGITEQIITGLSRMPYMFVIARNTSFTYKGKPVKIQQIAEELGVQYVLEGSIQRSGDRIRVTAQLIDALSGRHVWSERYDRVLEDLFAVQDEIMMNIMRAMEVKVAGLGIAEYQAPSRSVEAYIKVLKAIELAYRWNKDDNALARKLYEEAIVLDSEYGTAYELLGWCYFRDATFGWADDHVKTYAKAEELGKKAIALGNTLGHMLLMSVYDMQGQTEKALAEGEKAFAILPNSANLNILFSRVLTNVGRFEEAIARAKRAIRLNPHHQPWYFYFLARSYFCAGKNEEALEAFQLLPKKGILAWMYLASIYSQLGREAEARQAAEEIYKIAPDYSYEKYWGKQSWGFYDKEVNRRFLESLEKLGLKNK